MTDSHRAPNSVPDSDQAGTERTFPDHFDVAISFAGPQRELAEGIATTVRRAGFEVFYDNFYTDQLWGKELPVFLDTIYRNKAKHCLILVSKEYVEREWTNFERQSAIARAVRDRGMDYILPLQIDEGVIPPGLTPTIVYLPAKGKTAEEIAEF